MYELFRVGTNEAVRNIRVSEERGSTVLRFYAIINAFVKRLEFLKEKEADLPVNVNKQVIFI